MAKDKIISSKTILTCQAARLVEDVVQGPGVGAHIVGVGRVELVCAPQGPGQPHILGQKARLACKAWPKGFEVAMGPRGWGRVREWRPALHGMVLCHSGW